MFFYQQSDVVNHPGNRPLAGAAWNGAEIGTKWLPIEIASTISARHVYDSHLPTTGED